jgi:hypothetical protein
VVLGFELARQATLSLELGSPVCLSSFLPSFLLPFLSFGGPGV